MMHGQTKIKLKVNILNFFRPYVKENEFINLQLFLYYWKKNELMKQINTSK